MKAIYALIISLAVCGLAAALEGLCAGRNVKSFYATLRFPSYSAPLWVWSIIGGVYYIIFWFVLYRLLKLESSPPRTATLILLVFMMVVNALTNYIIFRIRNLHLSFIVGCFFPIMDATLFTLIVQLDTLAAWSLVPYLIYRIYAVWWGYSVWKLNRSTSL